MAIIDFFGKAMPLSNGLIYNSYALSASPNGTVVGSALGDTFSFGVVPGTAIGGGGDDRYYGVNMKSSIVELAGGGIDTVVCGNFVMSDNIENAILGGAVGVVGNTLGNYIQGSTTGQSIDGGKGNDVMSGGGGNDAFVFNAGSGYDVVLDFDAGATKASDTVRLAGFTSFKSLADVKNAMTQVGGDVVLKLSATDSVKFVGEKIGDFTADNFQLRFDPTVLKQSFGDEFNSFNLQNGTAGVWRTDYGWGGDTNAAWARTLHGTGEKQLYVDPDLVAAGTTAVGINPFNVKDGILTIHADVTPQDKVEALHGYEYTSGMLSTRGNYAQTYGYFEARMKVPGETGAWPAFWLYSNSSSASELDVVEYRGGNDAYGGTTHDYSTGKKDASTGYVFDADLNSEFHDYGVLWTPETVTWYLDGVAVRSLPTPNDMHGPMFMIVNLAVDASVRPDFKGADLQVDYVRAYSLDDVRASTPGLPDGALSPVALRPEDATFVGTAGDDTFIVSSRQQTVFEYANKGVDTVKSSASYTLADNVENLTLTGGAIRATGNALDNVLTGNAKENNLVGLGGNDTLDGLAGADFMAGGTGNDTYVVDNVRDLVAEKASEGVDTVRASVDYTLAANVENLVLLGSVGRGAGNDFANTITGNAQANSLVGGGGADRLVGGLGNDSYTLDNAGDVVVEEANAGIEWVYSSVDYALTANVEHLSLTGTAVRGTGNELNNIFMGNASNNTLTGAGGVDRLDGGAGADMLIGGADNDSYVVDNVGDTVVEKANEGFDGVTSSVDYAIGENIEQLILTGSAVRGTALSSPATLVGNEIGNILTGAAGRDTLDGKGGADRLWGGGGDDRLTGGAGADTFVFTRNSGRDTVVDFNAAEDFVDWSDYQAAGINAVVKAAGANTVVTLGSDTVTFMNVTPAALATRVRSTEPGQAGSDPVTPKPGGSVANAPGNGDTPAVNAAPVLTGARSNLAHGTEDEPYQVTAAQLLAGFTDADGDSLSVTGLKASGGVVTAGANGTFTIGSTAGFHGTVDLTYFVTDGPAGRTAATHSFVVDAVNHAPALTGSQAVLAAGQQDEAYTVSAAQLLAGFTDVDGDSLSVMDLKASGGVVTAGANGMFTIASPAGFNGKVDLMYFVTDGQNGRTAATHSFVVDAVNHAPALTGSQAVLAAGQQDEAYTVSAAQLLAGFTDADGDALSVVGLTADRATVTDNGDGTYALASEAGFSGRVALSYSVSDGTAAVAANQGFLLADASVVNGTAGRDTLKAPSAAGWTLNGFAGADTVIGGDGADTMKGGADNDTYVVNNAGDVVVEEANAGTEWASATIDYALTANVEHLALIGGAVRGTGNELNNILLGNGLANTLTGGAGVDRLDGGAGADMLIGGADSDSYVVDSAGDVVVEKANEGFDGVISSVDYMLSDNIEQLTLTGTAVKGWAHAGGATLVGNEIGNILTGAAGRDTLDGKGGADRLWGGGGDDRLTGGAGADTFVFTRNSGRDTVVDFNADQDLVDWSDYQAAGINAVVKAAGANTVVTLGSDTVTFMNVKVADILHLDLFA